MADKDKSEPISDAERKRAEDSLKRDGAKDWPRDERKK